MSSKLKGKAKRPARKKSLINLNDPVRVELKEVYDNTQYDREKIGALMAWWDYLEDKRVEQAQAAGEPYEPALYVIPPQDRQAPTIQFYSPL